MSRNKRSQSAKRHGDPPTLPKDPVARKFYELFLTFLQLQREPPSKKDVSTLSSDSQGNDMASLALQFCVEALHEQNQEALIMLCYYFLMARPRHEGLVWSAMAYCIMPIQAVGFTTLSTPSGASF